MNEKVKSTLKKFRKGEDKKFVKKFTIIPLTVVFIYAFIRVPRIDSDFRYFNYVYNIIFYGFLINIIHLKLFMLFANWAEAKKIVAYYPLDTAPYDERVSFKRSIRTDVYEGVVSSFIKVMLFAVPSYLNFSAFEGFVAFYIIFNKWIAMALIALSLSVATYTIYWTYYKHRDVKISLIKDSYYFLDMVGNAKLFSYSYHKKIKGSIHTHRVIAENKDEIEKVLDSKDLDKIIEFFSKFRDMWWFNQRSDVAFNNPNDRKERAM